MVRQLRDWAVPYMVTNIARERGTIVSYFKSGGSTFIQKIGNLVPEYTVS